MVTAAAPASWTMCASSGALRARSFHPARIFTVTGMVTAFAIASMTAAACSGSRIRLQPALCLAIFGTGQPMFTSTMSAPMPSMICAAAAIFCGSPPKIWMETGRSSSVYSAYSSVRSMPRTSPSELTISVTTRPQPPWRFTSRRKAESVMPAIGATANGDGRATGPIFIVRSVRLDVGRVDLDAHGLADQIHGQHQPRLRGVFLQQPADDAAQRAVGDFDHHAFADQRAGIVLQLAADQHADALQLVVGNRRRLALERNDAHDAGALEHGQCVLGIEAREAVAGKERPVDLLLAVFPAAPLGDGRQERV